MSDLSSVHKISLDVWNTLITPHQEFSVCRAEMIAKLTESDAETVRRIYTEVKKFADDEAESYGRGYATTDLYQALVSGIFRELKRGRPTSTFIETVRGAVEILFTKMRPSFDREIVNQLSRLYRSGYRFNIASNSNFISGEIMEPFLRSKFDNFDFMVFSDLELVAKPHPKFFTSIVSRANVYPSSIVHVGDSHTCDMIGASFVGMRTKLVLNPSETADFLSTISK